MYVSFKNNLFSKLAERISLKVPFAENQSELETNEKHTEQHKNLIRSTLRVNVYHWEEAISYGKLKKRQRTVSPQITIYCRAVVGRAGHFKKMKSHWLAAGRVSLRASEINHTWTHLRPAEHSLMCPVLETQPIILWLPSECIAHIQIRTLARWTRSARPAVHISWPLPSRGDLIENCCWGRIFDYSDSKARGHKYNIMCAAPLKSFIWSRLTIIPKRIKYKAS